MEPFASALNRFLKATGHFVGMTRWFDESIGLDPRYLRRWRNEGVLASVRDWEHFEAKAREEFKGSPEKLKALDDLKVVWNYHRELDSNARPDFDAEAYRPEPRKHGSAAGLGRAAVPTAETLLARFIADTRIAAQLKSGTGSKAVYLDRVYVHREEPEKRVLQTVRSYLSAGKEAHGSWISVVGDAGHGKTSFLWCLTQECRHLSARLFPVQALQLSSNRLNEYAESFTRGGDPFIFVLDTLDLLVGIDDESLGNVLNTLRADGGLVITTCRRQEIKTLASRVRADQSVDLDRYDPDEAKAAIERYVGAFYAEWPERKRQAQIDYVWNLLDAQRKIQDLNFEPLLLRMIFEAYAPDAIPPDINTQKVYDHFWEERVLGDRAAKDHEIAHARAAMCLQLASYLYFETIGHTERVSVSAFVEHCKSHGVPGALPILHGLVSSGVLRWWQMKASVGFFHQTFLEYAAAKSLLEADAGEPRSQRIEELIAALKRADLFRVPVLKQFLIQSSGEDPELFEELCQAVAAVNTTVAAGLLLEVLGKATDVSNLHQRVLAWNARQPHLIRTVATEVLRYFPAKRVPLALEILDSHMNGERLGEICNVCAAYFAPMAPENTLRFLRESWRKTPTAFKGFEGALRMALIAAFREGSTEALDALVEILPTLSVRIQAGALTDLSTSWTPQNAPDAFVFLERMFPILVNGDQNESRTGFIKAFVSLHAVAPDLTHSLAKTLASKAGTSLDGKAAMLSARLIGIANPTAHVVDAAFTDLLRADPLLRMCASGLLREALRTRSEIMDRLLSLPQDVEPDEEIVSAIATVASGSQDAAKLLALLERWDFMERGSGNAFRLLMGTAAKANPEGTLAWLRRRSPFATADFHRRQILVGFQVLAESSAGSISKDDAKFFWQFGYLSVSATDEMKRVISGAAGWIAEIDAALGREVFQHIFKERKKDCINAAIGSLRYTGSPELVVFVFALTRTFSAHQTGHATFGQFLEAISERDFNIRASLLRELASPPSRAIIRRLDSPVVVSRVLALLKSTVKTDVALALDLATLCPLLNDGNAGTLSAVLENASHYMEGQDLARSILRRLLDLASKPAFRIGNSLRRALPRLDSILPHREVADAVLQKILSSTNWPEKTLEQLVRAAKAMDSWAQADEEAVHRSELPHRVKAVLLG